MTPLAAKTLELAAACIGTHEEPPGSNRSPRIDEWLRRRGLDPEKGSYPWCAAFACAMIEDAANALPELLQLHRSARCKNLVELNHEFYLAAPEPGCIFVHLNADGTGHTGFIETVNADGSLSSLEGNTDAAGGRTGGQVMRQTRSPGYAQVFIRIA